MPVTPMTEAPHVPRARALTGRALLALALLTAFYVLVVAIAVVLVIAPLLAWRFEAGIDVELLPAVVAGLVILRAAAPRRGRFKAPGVPARRDDQPGLWAFVDKVAAATHQRSPAEIRIFDEMNAYIVEVGGVGGIGARRILVIGLPLMKVLDPEELGSVVAHELGHLRGGGTRLGPLVNRTRAAMGGRLEDSDSRLGGFIFRWYARLYLRLTSGLARGLELAADAQAAAATSPRATASALARLPFATVAFEVYLRTEYIPVLVSGHQPPFLRGFDAFLMSTTAREHLRPETDVALGFGTKSGIDAHPPIDERLRALGADPRGATVSVPDASALELLAGVESLETRLVGRHARADMPLVQIPWSEVGRKALVPTWKKQRSQMVGELPEGFHLGALPLDRDGLAELGEDVEQRLGRTLSRPEREVYGHRAARAVIGELSAANGLTPEMVPGEPVWFGRPPDQFALFSAYDDVIEGRVPPSAWSEVLGEAGLPGGVVRADSPAAVPTGSARRDPSLGVTAGPPLAPPSSPAPVHLPAPPLPVSSPPPLPPPPAPSAPVAEPPRPLPRRPVPAAADRPPAPAAPGPSSLGGAPRPPRPVEAATLRQAFRVPVGMGRHQDLVIEGDLVTWRGIEVRASEVTHIAYTAGDVLEVRLWTTDRDLRVKMTANGRNRDASVPAWQALVRWTEERVEGRLVGAYLERLAERGRVSVGEQVLTANGVVVKGRVIPWAVLAGAEFDGRSVVISQRANTPEGSAPAVTIGAGEPDAILLPTLIAAASAASSTASG